MSATTIQATINDVDLPTIQHLFKMLKIKTTILEKDETTMTESDFRAMVTQSMARKEVKINREEMRQRLLK